MRVWDSEACVRRFDGVSGAEIIQLTSSAVLSINIYCEQPYCSPDGRRLAILRRAYAAPAGPSGLWIGDLETLYVTCIEHDGVVGVFNAAWSGLVHYLTTAGELKRLNLTTLGVEKVDVPFDPMLFGRDASVSPDQRYIIYRTVLPGKRPSVGIKRLDLHTLKQEVIYDNPEMVNPHMQFNPSNGKTILVQINRGWRVAENGAVLRTADLEKGVTHMLLDADGGNPRQLPVGPPYTASSTGHSAHVGDTGRVVVTTGWSHETFHLDPRTPEGNLVVAGPEDAAPTVFHAPDMRLYHVCASRCGRYFVADFRDGPLFDRSTRQIRSMGIAVGNFLTGRCRALVQDTLAGSGGGEHNHVHPYLSADNRHVIFNANPYFSPTQVFAARVPEDFLSSLDAPRAT